MFRSPRPTSDPVEVAREDDALLDLLDTGVVVVGHDGCVVAANIAASRLLSVADEELHGNHPGAWIEAARNARNEGLTSPPGAPARRLRVRRRAIGASTSGATAYLIDLMDVIDALDALDVREPTPSEAPAKLRRLEGTLRELSTISHNINNPLTALLGRAQLLKATSKGDPRVEKAADVIEESAARISGLARELSRTLRDALQEAADSSILVEAASPVGTERA